MRVGVVGLGNMGGPMATNLLAGGHEVAVFDVVPERGRALEEHGARAAASAADASRGAEVVSVVVLDGDQLDAVTTGPDGVLAGVAPGAVIAVHSTVHPDSVARVAAAAPAGVEVLDAPISGGVEGARGATLAIMVGGSEDAFARARPVLDSMGTLVLHLGPAGAGLAAKLARNLMGYVSYLAVQEGRHLAEAADVDLEVLHQILEHTGVLSPMMRTMLSVRGGDSVYERDLQPLIDLAAKDLRVTLEFASSLGVELPATAVTLEHVAVAMGRREQRPSA